MEQLKFFPDKHMIKDKRRFRVGVALLIVTFFAFIIFPHIDVEMFYKLPNSGGAFVDFPRVLWCFWWALFGFSIAAIIASFEVHPNDKYSHMIGWTFYFSYIMLDGIAIFVGSVLVATILNAIPYTQIDHTYYFMSACISFYFGIIADIQMPMKIAGIKA